MENINVVINEANMEANELKQLIEFVDKNVGIEKREKIFIKSKSLNERAKKNPDLKKYIDKCLYDDHNRQVADAKSRRDEKELQALSNKAMKFAGYVDSESEVNEFFKSFVDRTFLDREMNKLYKAKEQNNQEKIYEVYKRIYEMASSETNKPFYVENEFAKGFVQVHIDEYRKMKIELPEQTREEEQYAI